MSIIGLAGFSGGRLKDAVDVSLHVDVLGPCRHEAWMRKRSLLYGITNPRIDDGYDRAMAAGRVGGKVLGAADSGFLLAYAPDEARSSFTAALSEYRGYDVRFDSVGTTINYSDCTMLNAAAGNTTADAGLQRVSAR